MAVIQAVSHHFLSSLELLRCVHSCHPVLLWTRLAKFSKAALTLGCHALVWYYVLNRVMCFSLGIV